MLIGITLGVTGGSAFNTLLAALSFHQFFEVSSSGARAARGTTCLLREVPPAGMAGWETKGRTVHLVRPGRPAPLHIFTSPLPPLCPSLR